MSKIQAISLDTKDREPREVKNDMSVHTYPWRWSSWRGFWHNIAAWFDNRKAAKQRAKLGYCMGDIWNCGDRIVDYIVVTLCEYRNKAMGWPDQYFTTMEEWIAYIDEIIDLLDYSRQDPDGLNEYTALYDEALLKPREERTEDDEVIITKYRDKWREIYEEQIAHRKVAFAKLAAHIDHIWW